MHRPPWAPAEADITGPGEARVHDLHLGGPHDVAPDRAAARSALAGPGGRD